MIRFATADFDATDRSGLRDALRRCALESHHECVGITSFRSVDELILAMERLRKDYFDVVFVRIDKPPHASNSSNFHREMLEKLHAIRESHPNVTLVITSNDTKAAIEAYDLGAVFLLLSSGYDGVRHALTESMLRLGWDNQACLAVRSASRIDNIAIRDIQFVESSKRGPVIHLPGGQTITARGTLKGLYEQLASPAGGSHTDTESLVMAGSSFIVNLDNVIASGKGTLVFASGETIIVPVRKRKEIEELLEAYQAGHARIYAVENA